jgi:hypothetical protein
MPVRRPVAHDVGPHDRRLDRRKHPSASMALMPD